MANIQMIEGVKGVSYKLTAYCGYDSRGRQIRKTKTWKPTPGMSVRQADKEAAYQAEKFEDEINKGSTAFDGKVKFEEYALIWLKNAQIAPATRTGYEIYIKRINAAIGHLRLETIQAHHLEAFYKNLSEDGVNNRGRHAVSSRLNDEISDRNLSKNKLSEMADVSSATVRAACESRHISLESAEKISNALEIPTNQLFILQKNTTGLSDKTILHHHRLISAILGKAKKERIIPFNVATEHTTAPRVRRKEAKYLDDEQARQLVTLLLDEEDIRVKTSILLALYSGVRRGELCGLSWEDIDERLEVIHVLKASQYQKGRGVVEVPTKNENSKRVIKLPPFMFEILSKYRKWWLEQQVLNGDRWKGEANRLFIQDDGKPLNPDTINFWLEKFIEKHNLQHFTPHSLRHTFSTLQIIAGVDIRTLQARTGHAQASTLTNTYAHSIKTAAEAAADVLDNILTPKNIKNELT